MPVLANKENCTGCLACYNACHHNAISIAADNEGFLQPVVNSTACVECKLCERSCPVITESININSKQPKAYALWSTLDRTVSSSGGAFSAFARYTISKGGVVFGAVYDENLNLHHCEAKTIEELAPMRGSKYMQSDIGDTFRKVKQYLCAGRYVLFCGTPCQIDGIKSFLRKDYDKLILLDLACHGVPSNRMFQSYKKKLEKRLGKVKENIKIVNYGFRRCKGWGKSPSFTSDNNNWYYLYGVDALYMEAFNANAFFRKCCYSCKYSSLPRVGDCSLADFWGIGRHGNPFRHDVMNGVSLVIVNTEKGQNHLDSLTDVFCEERTLKEALIENHNLREPSHLHSNRDEIIADFFNPNVSLEDIDKRYHLVNHSCKATIKSLAYKYGIFDFVKRIYNKYKTL